MWFQSPAIPFCSLTATPSMSSRRLTIIKKNGASCERIDLSEIRPGDEVTVFGLTNCNALPNLNFYGYIVVVED